MTDRFDLEGDVATRLIEYVADKLSAQGQNSRYCGLRWSDNQPTDGTCDELLVIDGDGTEYTLEIDITLWPTEPKNWGYTRVQRPPRVVTERATDDRL